MNILRHEKIPIHPTFVMERVDKYRDENGKSTIHRAVEVALKNNETSTLEQMLDINLSMYQANVNGNTCLR